MAKWDKEYLKLCKKILTEGVEVENIHMFKQQMKQY